MTRARSLFGFLFLLAGVATSYSQEEATIHDSIVSEKNQLSNGLRKAVALKSESLNGAERQDVLGRLKSGDYQVEFVDYRLKDGTHWIASELSINSANGLRKISAGPRAGELLLLRGNSLEFDVSRFRGVWKEREESLADRDSNPFAAGEPLVLSPRRILKQDSTNKQLVLNYEADGLSPVRAVWKVEPEGFSVRLHTTVSQDGQYCFVFSPFTSRDRQSIRNVLMPPRYQFKRIPEKPELLASALMPHPVALVELAPASGGTSNSCTYGISAQPENLPFEFPTNSQWHSPYGFSLLDWASRISPTGFSPILGTLESQLQRNDSLETSFRIILKSQDWVKTFQSVSERVYGVQDYRTPRQGSLSDAVVNMTELIQDEEASGWDPELKGFYNIEMRNGVTQASPLTVLSAALLSRNETLYKTRSLPTIAYLLSRKWAHFGRPYEIGDWSGKVHAHPPYGTGSLGQRKKFFGTPVWQGLDALTEGLNPWLEAYILPDGNFYHGDSNMQSAPHWSAMLAAYRYNPSDALLAEIQRKADDYIENNPYERATEPVPITTFYEVGTYPYWKDLIDLYELTGESRYLEAAATYGTISIAGHWAHPPVTDDSVIIHPDGKVDADTRILWKNEKWYRLGTQQHLWLEDKSGRQWLKYFEVPEAKVPASEVSRVGLGFETPGTLVFPGFIRGDQGLKNILMSANAPDLLRVAHRTGDPIFKTYARNMTIGRFTNYPGYYYTAYSNLPQNPDYPIEGPDLSRFYYHHIPVHLAFTMDYLMAQAELRSDDQIAFPWVKQQGYVWFANRVYGLMPGSVFGEKNLRLRMDRNLVHNTRPNVDWFIAESDDQVVLVAMSQSDSVIHFRPDLNAERLSLDLSSGARVHHANGGVWETTDEPMPRVEIAPKGMVAFAFARSSKAPTAEAVNTLSEAPKSIELGEALGGELKVFRIRSPLFEDGIYVHLSEGARDTLKVTFHLKGKSPLHRDRYPYEAIFYPIDRADNALLKVTIDNIDSGKTKSVEVPVGH